MAQRTAVVITALEVEFTAVADRLSGCTWKAHPSGSRYLVGTHGGWTVAVAEIGRGNEEAGYATERALEFFKPQVSLFVGVAGGIKDVDLGDVVFATDVFGYEYGKETEGVFRPRGQVASSSFELVQSARQLRHDLRSEHFRIVVEPIAAGGKVVAGTSTPSAQLIGQHYSQVVATEQEGLGFLKAGSARSDVAVGVIRGISDLLSGKSDSDAAGWQKVAADNSAKFALRLLETYAPAPQETIDSVSEHLVAAWLRLRGWQGVDPAARRTTRNRMGRLLEELQDLIADRLENISRGYLIDADRSAIFNAAVTALQSLTPLPPAQVDLGTIRSLLGGPPGTKPVKALENFLSDVSAFLAETYLAFPEIATSPIGDVVGQASEMRAKLERALVELPHRRSLHDNTQDDVAYLTDYLRAVGQRLDTLEILGLDLERLVERYSLTTAFVALSASSNVDGQGAGRHNEVPNVLAASNALVLVGDAGSGKTTLLQWIAVSAARNQWPLQLGHWHGKVPFLVRLRKYADGRPPEVEDFTLEVASTLSGRKPSRWCSDVLHEGNAIVLIDGLDELPAPLRPDVQTWLDDLRSSYPDNVFIITSRPVALRDKSFKLNGLQLAYLHPMGPSQINALVLHWHRSTSQGLPEADRADHQAKGDLVAEHILQNPALLDLAGSPLLCAVLCSLAYTHKGIGGLPRRRVDLYEAALVMLTGRRDSERRIIAPMGAAERMLLLEDLAQWLIRNGQSEIPREKAIRHIKRTLGSLQHVTITAEEALQDLLERSILREPAVDVIDFVHRTFEEYLAARWINNEDDFGALLSRADDPALAGVIALVAGLARRQDASMIMSKLLDMAEASDSDAAYGLVMSCIDAALVVDPAIMSRAQVYLATLVPPKNFDDITRLAAGGKASVALLRNFLTEEQTQELWIGSYDRCVETLAKIGSPEALRALMEIPDLLRLHLADTLVYAWSYFSPAAYAKHVLIPLDEMVQVSITDESRLRFTGIVSETYRFHALISKLTPEILAGARLNEIYVRDPLPPTGLDHLAKVDSLEIVNIPHLLPSTDQTTWISDDIRLTTVKSLSIGIYEGWVQEVDCSALLDFPNLTELQLDPGGALLKNFNALNELQGLELLDLSEAEISELRSAHLSLPNLRVLRAPYWKNEDFTAIAGCVNLEVLDATDSDVETLAGLEGMAGLRELVLRDCFFLTDLSGLDELRFLEDVDLRDCPTLDDAALEIALSMAHRAQLELAGSSLEHRISESWIAENIGINPEAVASFAETDDLIEHFTRAVEGTAPEDDDLSFAHGWLVGKPTEIDYASSALAMDLDAARFPVPER